ncbi:hypothetical protein [Paraburkholderia sp. J67]|nr:hypothetical protein [Paraburkholderia sp. J67]
MSELKKRAFIETRAAAEQAIKHFFIFLRIFTQVRTSILAA